MSLTKLIQEMTDRLKGRGKITIEKEKGFVRFVFETDEPRKCGFVECLHQRQIREMKAGDEAAYAAHLVSTWLHKLGLSR